MVGFDREKFKDAMHYVIAKAGDHGGFGATKIYKALWFAEGKTFLLTGQPMFNAEYTRDQFGPRPKLGMQIREELVAEGRIRTWKDRYYNRVQWRFRALTVPDMRRFNRDEIQTLDYWTKHIDEDHTAASISEESHDYAWEIAKQGDPLPIHAFLASRWRDPTDEELDRARKRWASR